jgi:hypothetical protein
MKSAKSSVTSPVSVGSTVLVRCVTHYYTGRIVSVTKEEILLSDAAWIADTGKFSEALANGVLREVEPYPDGIISISRGAIVDVCTWNHPLPRTVK